jgi:plasmid maintenance system antidote protein VapI
MKLEELICPHPLLSVAKVAREIGYSRTHLQNVLDGRLPMGPKLAKALEIYFKGKVQLDDLMKHHNAAREMKRQKKQEREEKKQQKLKQMMTDCAKQALEDFFKEHQAK